MDANNNLNLFHEWTMNAFNQTVYIHTIRYSAKCLLIWLSNNGKFENFSCALQTPYERLPVSTDIFKLNNEINSDSQLSNDLARKLARKLNKQVFVSCNLNENENIEIYPLIEKHLFDEINLNKDKF